MIQNYWEKFLKENNPANIKLKGTICFADNKKDAEQACANILSGMLSSWCYPADGYHVSMRGIAKAGDLNIVVNWDDEPACVIETTKLEQKRFGDMFSENEAEREAKEAEFKRELEELGLEFNEDILVCREEFRVIWYDRA